MLNLFSLNFYHFSCIFLKCEMHRILHIVVFFVGGSTSSLASTIQCKLNLIVSYSFNLEGLVFPPPKCNTCCILKLHLFLLLATHSTQLQNAMHIALVVFVLCCLLGSHSPTHCFLYYPHAHADHLRVKQSVQEKVTMYLLLEPKMHNWTDTKFASKNAVHPWKSAKTVCW